MSESRNPVTNRLDAESGESVKSCVSPGRGLAEALIPCLRESRLKRERKEAEWRAFCESGQMQRAAEAMRRSQVAFAEIQDAVTRLMEAAKERRKWIERERERCSGKYQKPSRRAYRRIRRARA